MPPFDPNYVEHSISAGFIEVMNRDGVSVPAYRAWPLVAGRFPGVALLHDWWGLTDPIRHLANRLAEGGYNVIVPDLFDGRKANTPREAMALVGALDDDEVRRRVSAAVDVVEFHTHSNHQAAVFGIGMGGGLALATAQARDDIEAVVVYSAFPQAYLTTLDQISAPVLAAYGDQNALVPLAVRQQFEAALKSAGAERGNEFVTLPGVGHDFLAADLTDEQRSAVRGLFHRTQSFLRRHLKRGAPHG